jgi:hypothetical protein
MVFPPVSSSVISISQAPIVCISLLPNGTWTNKYCQTIQQSGGSTVSQSNTPGTECLCQILGPTTVVADVNYLFVASN